MKKIDNNVKIKGLILSKNKIIQASDKEVSRVQLLHSFKNNKSEIEELLDECLTINFSKSTTKVLRRFKSQLFTCSAQNARYFIRYLSNCLGAIRAHSAKMESPTGLTILNLPYSRGCLAPSEDPFLPSQTKLISFLIDSGSMVNIMSLQHLKKLQFSEDMVQPVEREYIIESSTEIKNNCIFGTIELKIYLLGEDGNFYHSNINFLIANGTIRCQDIIIGTKWLRKHKASLDLDINSTLSLRLRDNKGYLGKHKLSLEPEKSTFKLMDGGDDNIEIYSTKLIFNKSGDASDTPFSNGSASVKPFPLG